MTEADIIQSAASMTHRSIRIPVTKTPEEAGIRQEKGDDGLTYSYDISTDRLICGAKTRGGNYCKKDPIRGRNRCQLHGGKSPRGIAAGRFKTGKYSKDLPARLSERYLTATSDEKLLELRDEIALIETRLGDLLSRADTGESGATWSQIKTAYEQLRKAASVNDQRKFTESLNEMGRLITKGAGDYAVWDEIFKAVSAKRRGVETERKRLVDLKQMMTAEQAMGMLSFVVATLKAQAYRHFDKHDADKFLADVSVEINNFLASNGGFNK
jgi:hypothetical protein